jgi:hypothetical protein
MKILNDEFVTDWLLEENQSENGIEMPNGMKCDINLSIKQLQVHIDHGCGCKITVDKKGSWLFPCDGHCEKANSLMDGDIIHKRL